MYRAVALLLVSVLAYAATGASRTELDAKIRATITEFKAVPAAEELAQDAIGMLVFPNIIKGGSGIGAEHGRGALLIDGKITDYYRVTSVSIGFQLGGQARRRVVLFMTSEALKEFRESDGWEVGVDGSVTALQFGVGKQIDSNTLRDPIIGFTFGNRGLMYDASFEGSKFRKDD